MSDRVSKKLIYLRWFVLRFALALYDILAINLSFYLALVIRFYVANEFHSVAGIYLDAFAKFAPVYTLFCIVVFGFFKLYSSMWRYTGINDINRILTANAVCIVAQVAGSWIFVQRMPISYYFIGGVLQVFLVAAVRLSYRLVIIEYQRIRNRKLSSAAANAMVIGDGEMGRTVLKQLDRENAVRPVCVMSYRNSGFEIMMDGIPVVSGIENLGSALKKYKVDFVIIADSFMPAEARRSVKDYCKKNEIEVQDFSGYLQNSSGSMTLKGLLEYCTGAVEVIVEGKSRSFANAEQALMELTGRYVVKAVYARADRLVIELANHNVIPNDLNAAWVQAVEKETGEAISFF